MRRRGVAVDPHAGVVDEGEFRARGEVRGGVRGEGVEELDDFRTGAGDVDNYVDGVAGYGGGPDGGVGDGGDDGGNFMLTEKKRFGRGAEDDEDAVAACAECEGCRDCGGKCGVREVGKGVVQPMKPVPPKMRTLTIVSGVCLGSEEGNCGGEGRFISLSMRHSARNVAF